MYSLSGITVSEGVSEGRAFLIIPRTLEDVPEVGQGLNPSEEIAKYRRVSREFASKLNNAMSGTVPDKVRDLFGAVAAYITNADNTRAIELQIELGKSAAEAAQAVLLPKIARLSHPTVELEPKRQEGAGAAPGVGADPAAAGGHAAGGAQAPAQAPAACAPEGECAACDAYAASQEAGTLRELPVADVRLRSLKVTPEHMGAINPEVLAAQATQVAVHVADDADEMQVVAHELNLLMRDFISTINHNRLAADDMPQLSEPSVIIAADLTPASFLSLHTELVRAVVLEGGEASGHLATVLRDLCIPAIYGVKGALTISNGEHILVDATRGSILVEPPKDAARAFIASQGRFEDSDDADDNDCGMTVAGSMGAMGPVSGLTHFARYLHHGLGLLRSEFLFLNYHHEPSIEEMTQTFAEVFNQVPKGAPLTARTFDFVGDKKPLFTLEMDERGPLRKYGAQVGSVLLKKELKALLLASVGRDINIVFPLITRCSEAKALNNLLAESIDELLAQGKEIGTAHVGLMIETPAAVLSARAFAAFGEMFLIGTSSLAEYAAAPRPPEDYFTPALAKMIAIACKAAHSEGVTVGVAGRFAMRIELLPFYLAMGVTYLTTDATALHKVRKELQRLNDQNYSAYFDSKLYQAVMDVASAHDLQRLLFHDEYAFSGQNVVPDFQ